MCSFEDLAVLVCTAVSLGNQCLCFEGSRDLTNFSQKSRALNMRRFVAPKCLELILITRWCSIILKKS